MDPTLGMDPGNVLGMFDPGECLRRYRACQGNEPDCPRNGSGTREPYKALSPDGNPEFSTVLKVVRALGLRLHAAADA